MGVTPEATLIEKESLHTRENAEHVLTLLQEHQMKQVFLITTPFHQLRTYLTFATVFQPHGIRMSNYYADWGKWHPNFHHIFRCATTIQLHRHHIL